MSPEQRLIDNYASLVIRYGRRARRKYYQNLLQTWSEVGRDPILAATRVEKIKERVRERESGMGMGRS